VGPRCGPCYPPPAASISPADTVGTSSRLGWLAISMLRPARGAPVLTLRIASPASSLPEYHAKYVACRLGCRAIDLKASALNGSSLGGVAPAGSGRALVPRPLTVCVLPPGLKPSTGLRSVFDHCFDPRSATPLVLERGPRARPGVSLISERWPVRMACLSLSSEISFSSRIISRSSSSVVGRPPRAYVLSLGGRSSSTMSSGCRSTSCSCARPPPCRRSRCWRQWPDTVPFPARRLHPQDGPRGPPTSTGRPDRYRTVSGPSRVAEPGCRDRQRSGFLRRRPRRQQRRSSTRRRTSSAPSRRLTRHPRGHGQDAGGRRPARYHLLEEVSPLDTSFSCSNSDLEEKENLGGQCSSRPFASHARIKLRRLSGSLVQYQGVPSRSRLRDRLPAVAVGGSSLECVRSRQGRRTRARQARHPSSRPGSPHPFQRARLKIMPDP